MNKYIFFIILSFSISGCRAQKLSENKNITSLYKTDSLLLWGKIKYNNENIISLPEVKKRFFIKQGKLYDKYKKNEVSDLTIQFRKSEINSEDVYVKNGLPVNSYYEKNHGNMDWRLINYDEKGNLNGVFVVANYQTTFVNGNGQWKNYYYKEYKNLNTTGFRSKEEGEVKNNYKIGKWKYYNKEGKIDSTKTYTLKDSVDVRFPHCIFNKNEPCY